MPTAPMSGPNGVLPVPAAVLQKGNQSVQQSSSGTKASSPKSKLVVRRLPPGLTQAEFETALGQEWRVGGGRVDWFSYKPGKTSKDLSKPSRPARAYLRVTDQAHVTPLAERVRQTPFSDAKNTTRDAALIGPPSLILAPYGRVPGGRRRHDGRQGLIDQDPEFIEFLESLTNPPAKPAQADTADVEKGEKAKTTPLIEHLREKKAAKESKAQATKAAKHARQESRETGKGEKVAEKKIMSKPAKETVATADKKNRMSRAEKAAVKDAAKPLNKETTPIQPNSVATAPSSSTEPASSSPAPAAAERRRERGNAGIAAKILQRDLGIGPGATSSRRSARKEAASAEASTTTKQADASPQSSKDSVEPGVRADKTTPSAPPRSVKKDTRPSRAERRAQKVAVAGEKGGADGSSETGKSPATKPPKVPTILKKQATASPATQPGEPPKGPASSTPAHKDRATATKPSSAASSTTAASPAPVAVAGTDSTTITPPGPRQAFLKHANPSQGITEPLLHTAFSVFGPITHVEIDKRKGFAYVDFASPDGLRAAVAASPVKVAQGAVQVLERRDRPPKAGGHVPGASGSGGKGAGYRGRGRMGKGAGGGLMKSETEASASASTASPAAVGPVSGSGGNADGAG